MTDLTINGATVVFKTSGARRLFVGTELTCRMLVRKQLPQSGFDDLVFRDADISHIAVITYRRNTDNTGGLVEPGKLTAFNYQRISVARLSYKPEFRDVSTSCNYQDVSEDGRRQENGMLTPTVAGMSQIYYSGIDENTPLPKK
ncbi:hypothetical protein [Mesorhizobium sp. B2-6-2]|uniref:hypothetical protein n=1 Tax=Mesorhizobium sp. B2-6-2 TaxID=2589915 RepID=UPI00112B2B1B|nr:hypothetical protein [Mesorhizobium sp. B2-6-2]TPJ73452.1 hypothetical protein FJ419_26005 [Mesorhizobium sp. B2-6-2]